MFNGCKASMSYQLIISYSQHQGVIANVSEPEAAQDAKQSAAAMSATNSVQDLSQEICTYSSRTELLLHLEHLLTESTPTVSILSRVDKSLDLLSYSQ